MKNSRYLAMFLTVLLLLGVCSAVSASGKVPVLKATSDPAGAALFVDGRSTGLHTPCTVTGLTLGHHHLKFTKPNYRPEEKDVDLVVGDNQADVSMAETFLYYMWLGLPSLLLGALMTLFLTCISVCNGVFIGTMAGIARVVHNKIINFIAGIYVDFIRGTPLLVQIFMIHFGMPPILGVLFNHGQAIPINPFVSAFSALSINSGAYVAEIIRAGIQSIDRGQMEAARSLGMTYRQSMRHVVLPQALKRVVPPLGNEFIAMLKDSSLVSVIGMEELVRKAQVIVTRSYRPTETWLEVGLLFLIMTIPFTRLVARLERRLKVGD